MEVLNFFNSMLGKILFFLPNSPFQAYLNVLEGQEWLKWLNWIIPVNQMIPIGIAWLSAVGGYYLYMIILRWARAIE